MSNPYLRGGKANCFYEPYLRLCEIIMESHSVIESFTIRSQPFEPIDFRAEKYLTSLLMHYLIMPVFSSFV